MTTKTTKTTKTTRPTPTPLETPTIQMEASMAMYDGGARQDRIRVSDADREQVTERLRDHFAEGRLTREELDERVTAALSAKTAGDLRRLMVDLPGDAPVAPPVPVAGPLLVRRRPRILPLMALILLAAVLIPGGAWAVLAFFQIVLVLLLAAG